MAHPPAQDHHDHDHAASAGHDHDHGGHAGHGHDHSHVPAVTSANEKKILISFFIIFGFMLVEAAGGIISGSLALLADAGHMLTDAFAPRAMAAASGVFTPPPTPHFPATAKRVIHLFMAGAPSQLELFDNKPALTKLAGKPLPPSVIGGQRFAQ